MDDAGAADCEPMTTERITIGRREYFCAKLDDEEMPSKAVMDSMRDALAKAMNADFERCTYAAFGCVPPEKPAEPKPVKGRVIEPLRLR